MTQWVHALAARADSALRKIDQIVRGLDLKAKGKLGSSSGRVLHWSPRPSFFQQSATFVGEVVEDTGYDSQSLGEQFILATRNATADRW